MKIVFMGTPEFSVPSLESLIEHHEVQGVFTQPDRPKGRGKKVAMSPVKELALKHSIPVYQPLKLKNNEEMIAIIKDLNPDFIIVVAFGQLLPKEVLEIPKFGCINLHASLLPAYRGAAPINWCLINGEKKSGNTTMLMDIGLDTGDMLLKEELILDNKITAGELHDKLSESGASLLLRTIDGIIGKTIIPEKQQDALSCYAPILNKNLGEINWHKSAEEIHNLIRGLNPWPTAYTYYKDEILKIHESSIVKNTPKLPAGTITEVSKKGILVAAGENSLLIEKLQFPNSKPLRVSDYLNGNSIDNYFVLGKEN